MLPRYNEEYAYFNHFFFYFLVNLISFLLPLFLQQLLPFLILHHISKLHITVLHLTLHYSTLNYPTSPRFHVLSLSCFVFYLFILFYFILFYFLLHTNLVCLAVCLSVSWLSVCLIFCSSN